MSQLATSPVLHPSKKNKILAALGAVVIGHAGVLFALTHMKPVELKPLTPPKPIQVRLIDPPKPKVEPPKPVQPPKPKEVKIQDAPPPPPKKVEKIEQVKKEVVKPKVVQPPKPTKVETPPPVIPPVVTEVVTPKPPVVIEKPVVVEAPPTPPAPPAPPTPPAPPAPVAPPAPPAPAVDMTPRNLGSGASAAWKRAPKPKLMQTDLADVTSNVVVLRIDVDEKGRIKARVVQSSGSSKVDKEMVRAVQAASFHPYKENGVAVPFFAEQSFHVQ